jgi:hypothetical protein
MFHIFALCLHHAPIFSSSLLFRGLPANPVSQSFVHSLLPSFRKSFGMEAARTDAVPIVLSEALGGGFHNPSDPSLLCSVCCRRGKFSSKLIKVNGVYSSAACNVCKGQQGYFPMNGGVSCHYCGRESRLLFDSNNSSAPTCTFLCDVCGGLYLEVLDPKDGPVVLDTCT